MCFQAAAAAIAIAQSVVSFAAADADYDARVEQWQENRNAALAAGRDEQKSLTIRMAQEQEAYTQKRQMNNIEQAEAAASAEASAAASGVSGLSLDNILRGINRESTRKQSADKVNYQNTVQQLTEELKGTNTTIENRVNSVQVGSKPNPLGYALQGVGGALNAYKGTS
ncbi:hypothetical protein IB276_22500 [Ensifer sp. ENS04]|uniref:virion core protein, T7 gp14 family n=1 Tax=Ensifer sp. ENS04 TaxID=2769281 RepID=UPI0017870857|nr:hypothetical protein [Ensifer sp. ENS04]MBD9542219.1 hypothetical protein [Ensifer sp. ENS04]